ncbi:MULTISPECIES: DUF6903 family protein [unclassified Curtobacterium]|uniref:DUF6903 family protein n=1 Tax=unclassified Curtobacterium TaxID=257496 RepID=UPI000DA7E67F|nr:MULTISPECIES: hypothetical protein [unclassified Curtobacterium]PZE23554.1 hypothetical protein DEI86_14250 [Curtobacterium sp. MCBD17_028]PZE73474.1 hypothetical protein DEI82_14075 [Curtobacterium sp. MCBD17_019]PZF60736.1 hypothetical protein DEI81_12110 [Curtobacterium sp. MCBD17_013]WIB62969.1 hypothetical protein DEI94_12510 [Curtobacterium sp. MCBD17_040]WIB66820.1 hypothetical protein DEI93_12745 [Curtobacterium sp. MCBD17_035]
MKESTAAALVIVARVVAVLVCVVLVVVARTHVGWPSLLLMLVGLAGLIAVLWSYNRRFR